MRLDVGSMSDPSRPTKFGRWAFRSLAGLVFVFYSAYLINQFVFGEAPFKLIQRIREASP
jgi:hypothetical protein